MWIYLEQTQKAKKFRSNLLDNTCQWSIGKFHVFAQKCFYYATIHYLGF